VRPILLTLTIILFLGCSAEMPEELKWQELRSEDAGLIVDLPCVPKETATRFQEEPRPIHSYDYSCKLDGIRFLVSSRHYMDPFNEKSIAEFFETIEDINRTELGSIKRLEKSLSKNFRPAKAKKYEFVNDKGAILSQLAVANSERTFWITVAALPDSVWAEDKIRFGKVVNRTISSFKLISNVKRDDEAN